MSPEALETCPDCGKPIGKLLKDCPNLCAEKPLRADELKSIADCMRAGGTVGLRLQKRLVFTIDESKLQVGQLEARLVSLQTERDEVCRQLFEAAIRLDAKPADLDEVQAERERCINVAVSILRDQLTVDAIGHLVAKMHHPEEQRAGEHMCLRCDGPIMRCLVMCTGEPSEEPEEGEPADA